MAKDQESVRLSPEVWAQVNDLIGSFGDTQSEVISYVLRTWFSQNQPEIRDTKARIVDLMKPRKKNRPQHTRK